MERSLLRYCVRLTVYVMMVVGDRSTAASGIRKATDRRGKTSAKL